MDQPATENKYTEDFNKALKLYDDDRMADCLEACQEILEHAGELSRYLRVRTLILAASATQDYFQAEKYRKEAEALFGVARAMFPVKPENEDPSTTSSLVPKPHYANEATETKLKELRSLLDELAEIQKEEFQALDKPEDER